MLGRFIKFFVTDIFCVALFWRRRWSTARDVNDFFGLGLIFLRSFSRIKILPFLNGILARIKFFFTGGTHGVIVRIFEHIIFGSIFFLSFAALPLGRF